jgi:tripartite-type tricarboxylate transporter receptor subunit TctC
MLEVRSFSVLAFQYAVIAVVSLVAPGLLLMPGSVVAAAASDLKLVVGFAAGSGVDSIARVVAERVRMVSGRTVIVENRSGGGGRIAAEGVVRAEPDGNTILFAPIVTTAFTPFMFKNPGL